MLVTSLLIEFGLSEERPLAILSGNSIDHALLSLAAQVAGVPIAPISVAYSHLKDLGRLGQVLEILTPGLVFADDGKAFAGALELARLHLLSSFCSNSKSDPKSVQRYRCLANNQVKKPFGRS